MPKTVWGRKETIIWPRHMPICTYTVAAVVALTTFLACCARIHLATPLQRYSLPAYERSSAFGATLKSHKSSYRLLFIGGLHRSPRPAMNDDVVLGRTVSNDGQVLPLELSSDARQRGYAILVRGPEKNYIDARFSTYLKDVVFNGVTLTDFFEPPLLAGANPVADWVAVRSLQGHPAAEAVEVRTPSQRP